MMRTSHIRNATLFWFILVFLSSLASASTWYVRPNEGSYGSSDGTSYATAFDGFSGISWGSIGAGDTLYVCGTFTAEHMTVGASGSSGNPIVIDGACPGDAGTIANPGGNAVYAVGPKNYITVQNLTIYGLGNYTGIKSLQCGTNFTAQYNEIYNGNYAAILIAGSHTKVLHNNVHDMTQNGIWIVPVGCSGLTDQEVAYNTVDTIGTAGANYDGIFVGDGAGDATIHHNVVTNVSGSGGSSCIDTSNAEGKPSEAVSIYNNYVDGCYYGIGAGDDYVYDYFDIYYNIIGDATYGLAIRPLGQYHVYNNTFMGSGSIGMWIYAWSSPSPNRNMLVKNNIFTGTYSDLLNYSATGLTITSDYNDYYKLPSGGNDGISGQESHSLNTSPQFISSSDFHLQDTSPLRDAGTDVGLTEDYDGVTVPQNGTPDIGALEYNTGGGGEDTTPDQFTFTDVTDANISSVYESDLITIAGITGTSAVSISGDTGCEYSKNGAAYTSSAGNANLGDQFSVHVNSSASYSTATNCALTVGGVSDTYTVTTKANPSDTTPPVFTNTTDPSFAYGMTTVTLSGTTDENATCKYSDVTSTPYASMTSVFAGAGTTSQSSIVGDPVISDDFGRSDESPVDGNWTKNGSSTSASLKVQSQAILAIADSQRNSAYYSATQPPSDQCAELVVTGGGIGPMVRVQSGQSYETGYMFYGPLPESPYPSDLLLYRYNTNGTNTLLSHTPGTLSDGETAKVCAIGDQITAYVDDVEVTELASTDNTYSSGYAGVHSFDDTVSGDNFRAYGVDTMDSGTYHVYGRCADAENNVSDEFDISYTIGAASTTTNALSPGAILGAGASVQ